MPVGVNVTMPAASGAEIVNVTPAQAVPATPEPEALTEKTPTSGVGHGFAATGADAHDGATLSEERVLASAWFGGELVLLTVNEADSPVCPTATAEGPANSVWTPTPAYAAGAVTTNDAATVAIPTRTLIRRFIDIRRPQSRSFPTHIVAPSPRYGCRAAAGMRRRLPTVRAQPTTGR